ncbi:Chromosomal replication initiator protein DnaA [Gammaproteobacteria bacterium]
MVRWTDVIENLGARFQDKDATLWLSSVELEDQGDCLVILCPNQHVLDRIHREFGTEIREVVRALSQGDTQNVLLRLGHAESAVQSPRKAETAPSSAPSSPASTTQDHALKSFYRFENFVEGKSNRFAKAGAEQVVEAPGGPTNPLFIYGSTGLGKTHLMHAIGNRLEERHPGKKILYRHAEGFVQEMVSFLRENRMGEFQIKYRSLDLLLVDDVQFFAGKGATQEEFFHTFNALLDSRSQIVLSSDRYPKEIAELDDRLKSRFGMGLTVEIEPPELETRVAILQSKAAQMGWELPDDVAFYIGKSFRSHVRALEGALTRVTASARFLGKPLSIELARDSLRDAVAAHDKTVNIDEIQRVVAEYFGIRLRDLSQASRAQSVARPRQIAMTLARQLTSSSLPEIGKAFGGRDHTTVLHATRKVEELKASDPRVAEDFRNLVRILSN